MKLIRLIAMGLILITTHAIAVRTRGIHRAPEAGMPEITTRWADSDNGTTYHLKSYDLTANALFGQYDDIHFQENLLPQGKINYRYEPETNIDGSVLDVLFNNLVNELMGKKKKDKKTLKSKEFGDFKILKHTNFDFKHGTGLIILKCKDYPFVIKLFIESPKTLARPNGKDLEQHCLFMMAGGISRYQVGFTRIKNLQFVRDAIKRSPIWKDSVDTPRKWFWVPKNNRMIELTGRNISGHEELSIELPSVYGIVADTIDSDRTFSLWNAEDRAMALGFTNWLNDGMDPNISNYTIDKHTGKLIFVDTEYFPTTIGLTEPMAPKSYPAWYATMVQNFLTNVYFRTKRQRLRIRDGKEKPIMHVEQQRGRPKGTEIEPEFEKPSANLKAKTKHTAQPTLTRGKL